MFLLRIFEVQAVALGRVVTVPDIVGSYHAGDSGVGESEVTSQISINPFSSLYMYTYRYRYS